MDGRQRRCRHDHTLLPRRKDHPAARSRGSRRARLCRFVDRTVPNPDARLRRSTQPQGDRPPPHHTRDDLPIAKRRAAHSTVVCTRVFAPLERRVRLARAATGRGYVRGAMSPERVSRTSGNSSSDLPSLRNSSSDCRNPCASSGSNWLPPQRWISEMAMS